MNKSLLLDLLRQTDYVDELEYFASLDINNLASWELENLEAALDDAIIELTSAMHLDTACGIGFEQDFIANVTTIIGLLTCQLGKTEQKVSPIRSNNINRNES